jgi:ferredoxin-NADP reductase
MEPTEPMHYFVPNPEKQTLALIAKDADDCFELELMERVSISHDTFKFTFKLPEDDQVMGLPVGGHVFFHITDKEGEVISRKYTPISQVNEKGKVSFVIKAYLPCDEFPAGGVMSTHLAKMAVGDKIKMEGPKGLLFYQGFGNFQLRKKPIIKNKIGLIAGGSGITPCFQLLQASSLGKDSIPMVLLYSNKEKSDILLQDELNSFVNEHLRIFHTLTRHTDAKHGEWAGLKGRITEEMVKSCGFPEPSAETLIGYCGPAGFNKTVEELFAKLGYSKDMLYKF